MKPSIRDFGGLRMKALWLSLLLVPSVANSQNNKVKLLVVIDSRDLLAVDYRTTGNTVRQALLVGGLLDVGISAMRESGHSKKLRETVGEFDRFPILKGALTGAFASQSAYFELEFVPRDGKTDLKEAKSQGRHFVFEIEETFSGLISAWKLSSLSATSTVSYSLKDVASGKTLTKGSLSGFARESHEFDEGVSNRGAFVAEYPKAVGAVIGTIFGQITKDGHLGTMAQTAGIKDFPQPLTHFLEEYARKFEYTLGVPKGWTEIKMDSKYTMVLAPKGADRATFGLRLDIDLLIKELGQETDDLDVYAALFRNRVINLGYEVDTVTQTGISLKEGYRQLMFTRPDKVGKEIIILVPLGKQYVGLYSVVVLSDYEGLMKKYKSLVETNLASIEFKEKG